MLKIILRFLWNRKFKHKGNAAGRALSKMLREEGWDLRSVYISLGLGEPDKLCCMVIFRMDGELARFESCKSKEAAAGFFRKELFRRRYPANAIEKVHVEFASWQTIQTAGGLYYYLK